MAYRKWTKETRILLYQNLVDRFGPFHTWLGSNYPSEDRKEEYVQFLNDFGKVVSILSGDETTGGGVAQQIAWATTTQAEVKLQADTFILNIAAAYETGFIRARDLPTKLIVEREIVGKD